MKEYAVCAYPQTEAELPACMERYGFRHVTTEYITVNLTPDDPVYSRDMAVAMIESGRQNDLDNVDWLERCAANLVSASEREEIRRLIRERYGRRIALYDAGVRQWDASVSPTMIVRGVKE